MKTVLILGGTSDIGRAVALAYARAGWRIFLTARDLESVQRNINDITTRTDAKVAAFQLDLLDSDRFQSFIGNLPELPDSVVCVAGMLGNQDKAGTRPDQVITVLRTNFEGPAVFMNVIAHHFATRGSGAIIGVSSVAGDRGRASNYIYGSAKAGFTAFLSGLRARLVRQGVRVVTVKPGFVRTRMTEGMKLPPLLTASPEEVGEAIFRTERQTRGGVIYVRPVWRVIMTIIRILPEALFTRLPL